MNRRRFMVCVAGGAWLMAWGRGAVAASSRAARTIASYVEANRAGGYPGPVRNRNGLRKLDPGPWAG